MGQGEHECQRPVGGLRGEAGTVGGFNVGRDLAPDVAGRRRGDGGRGGSREEVVFEAQGGGVDFDDGDGFGGAGLHAGGGFAVGEALVAHVAFADDATVVRILRHVVGAFENAVFAADALVVEVTYDAGVFFFFVSSNGAAIHALGVEAVVAGGGDGLLEAGGVVAAFDEADVAPGFVFVETIESVAGHDAGFAAGAFIEFDLEGVLFALAGFFEGDEVFVEVGAGFAAVVGFGEAVDGSLQGRLFLEEFVDESVHEGQRLLASEVFGARG